MYMVPSCYMVYCIVKCIICKPRIQPTGSWDFENTNFEACRVINRCWRYNTFDYYNHSILTLVPDLFGLSIDYNFWYILETSLWL